MQTKIQTTETDTLIYTLAGLRQAYSVLSFLVAAAPAHDTEDKVCPLPCHPFNCMPL